MYTHATFTNNKEVPYLSVPYIEWFNFINSIKLFLISTENEISLLFTIQETNGFIFAGLIYSPSLVKGIVNATSSPPPTL